MFADWPSGQQPERRILRRWVQGKNPHVRYRFVVQAEEELPVKDQQ